MPDLTHTRQRRTHDLNHFFRSKQFRNAGDMRWFDENLEHGRFPSVAGCYVFISGGRAIYVGSTVNLNTRMRQHRNKPKAELSHWPRGMVTVKYRPSKKFGDWAMLELRLIRRLCPDGNTKHSRMI